MPHGIFGYLGLHPRNTRVAHQEKEVTDPKEAQQNLGGWINGLKALTEAEQ